MKAITLKTFGEVENLEIREIPVPEIAPNEVLVKVKIFPSQALVFVKEKSARGLVTTSIFLF